MSHYAVAVFASQPNEREFDRLLEPFNESDENYFIFEPVNEGELQSDWEKFKKNNLPISKARLEIYLREHKPSPKRPNMDLQ